MAMVEESRLGAPSACRQVPLEHKNQLVPGTILTGPAWRTVRRVVEVDRDVVTLEKIPANSTPPNHLHSLPPLGVDCACGLRRESTTNILPLTDGCIRTYVLVPIADTPLVQVDPHTVYRAGTDSVLAVAMDGGWNIENVPVVPLLYPLWTLPQPMIELLRLARNKRHGRQT